jgi:hypothetical protein
MSRYVYVVWSGINGTIEGIFRRESVAKKCLAKQPDYLYYGIDRVKVVE